MRFLCVYKPSKPEGGPPTQKEMDEMGKYMEESFKSGVLLSALQSGVTQASRAQIGADMRVVGATFTEEQLDQVRTLPGTPGGDFDAARVAAIREDIRAGRYQVHPDRIASGLLKSVRDLLGGKNEG